MLSFDDVCKELNLQEMIVEGGYFNQIYKSQVPSSIPNRCCGTSIYYGLKSENVSRWHKVTSDEIWMYHAGCPAIQMLLFEDGHHETRIIGADLKNGQRPQSIIPAGTWQAARLLQNGPDDWGLFGATVFPGFEYQDYAECKASELYSRWPDAEAEIKKNKLDFE
ncbi:hypothetical protein TRFO_20506 [Tritrichomonas foetus]|uniref:DUF985 domain-containing protein n=1 Tax=Tritrichomonas foetus TaxID=1144522 RepID=A0A1J4KGY5_9EUKA|nr:hypothetical protein TRFO_20506 [Tritrichomonas foetus]|eukprot:OHT10216.1 hypothetical protein TRFO_20506 [Tritrichomonas foetus]